MMLHSGLQAAPLHLNMKDISAIQNFLFEMLFNITKIPYEITIGREV
jgi:hypothetical protein